MYWFILLNESHNGVITRFEWTSAHSKDEDKFECLLNCLRIPEASERTNIKILFSTMSNTWLIEFYILIFT